MFSGFSLKTCPANQSTIIENQSIKKVRNIMLELTVKNHGTGAISGYDGENWVECAAKLIELVANENGDWQLDGLDISFTADGIDEDAAWEKLVNVALATKIVSIKEGDMRFSRYAYGVNVISPEGEEYEIENSGSAPLSVWRYMPSRYRTDRLAFWERGLYPYEQRTPEEVGFDKERDSVVLPTKDGYWRWAVRLPQGWRVVGGSVSYLDRPISRDALIK